MPEPDYSQKLPDYVAQELELRLGDQFNPCAPYPVLVADAVRTGIDVEAATDPGPSPREVMSDIQLAPEDGEPIIGSVEFEMKIDALGCSTIQHMRAVYLVTILSEEERASGDGQHLFGCSFVDFEVLSWEDPEDVDDDGRAVRMSAPRWWPLQMRPMGFIPEEIRLRAEDLITAEVLARSEASQSDPKPSFAPRHPLREAMTGE